MSPGHCGLVGWHLVHWQVAGSFPGQGTYLGCGSDPWSGHGQAATNRSFPLASIFLCLSLSLPLPHLLSSLSKINKCILGQR